MSKGGYPSVCVVDTYNTTRPALPPRMSPRRRSAEVAQTLLILLVSLALCGMVIEACFIYRLYRPDSAASASLSKHIAGEVVTSPPKIPSRGFPPSKPVAHLTDGQDVVHGKQIMAWSMNADPLLFEMGYKNQSLVIQKDGYYHVYSKISFFGIDEFYHSINWKTERYAGESIPLLMSRRSSEGSSNKRSNSYLAGVFHFTKDDAFFVKVSKTSHIARFKAYENIFGAYMI